MKDAPTLQQLCCEKLGLPSADFEEWLFWHCLSPRHRWLVKLLWQLNRPTFDVDLELARRVAGCHRLGKVAQAINQHREEYPVRGLWRRTLGLRISGQRVMDFAATVLPRGLAEEPGEPTWNLPSSGWGWKPARTKRT